MKASNVEQSSSSARSSASVSVACLSSVLLSSAFLLVGAGFMLVYSQLWVATATPQNQQDRPMRSLASVAAHGIRAESMPVSSGFNSAITMQQYRQNRRAARAGVDAGLTATDSIELFPNRGIDSADVDALQYPIESYVSADRQAALLNRLQYPFHLAEAFASKTAGLLKLADSKKSQLSRYAYIEANATLQGCFDSCWSLCEEGDSQLGLTGACSPTLAQY